MLYYMGMLGTSGLVTHHTDQLTEGQVELDLYGLVDVSDRADQRVVVLIIKEVLNQFDFIITTKACKKQQ